jgi:hypothetical protein
MFQLASASYWSKLKPQADVTDIDEKYGQSNFATSCRNDCMTDILSASIQKSGLNYVEG